MKFVMHRNRTISSTCGLSIEFKKGEPTLVPPAMYNEVIAAGGVPESEIPEDELPKGKPTPEQLADREKQMFDAFKKLVESNTREDFTAGGLPTAGALARELGWAPAAKERDTAWAKFLAEMKD
jgi:hypothetical protein